MADVGRELFMRSDQRYKRGKLKNSVGLDVGHGSGIKLYRNAVRAEM